MISEGGLLNDIQKGTNSCAELLLTYKGCKGAKKIKNSDTAIIYEGLISQSNGRAERYPEGYKKESSDGATPDP